MDDKELFCNDINTYIRNRGWKGGSLSNVYKDGLITIFPSYFSGLEIEWFYDRKNKTHLQYEKWFLEHIEPFMKKYNIDRNIITFHY